MAKFLFFPYSNQLGTTIPSITVANMLQEKGHEIIYASDGKYTNVLKEKGFTVYPIEEISYEVYRKHVEKNNVDFYTIEVVKRLVNLELEIIQKINPDVIVTNNRPTVKISAQIAKKKMVTIVIPTLTKYYGYQYFIPENHFLYKMFPFGDINKVVSSSITKFAFKMTMKAWAKNLNKVLKENNLPLMENYLDVYEGDVTLINQTYGLSPFNNLPSNFFFLEQNLNSTFGAKHTWANELDEHKKNGKKIIFVSMGSSSLKSYPLVMQTIKELLEKDEQYVLVSNHVGLKNDGKKHDRIYVESFINSAQILPKVDLVVTHGGINTMSECLLNNKLVIGVPEQGEQMWNLKYVESLGIGIMVSKFKLEKNPALLTNAIVSILKEDKYKQNLNIFIQRNNQTQAKRNDNAAIYESIMKLMDS